MTLKIGNIFSGPLKLQSGLKWQENGTFLPESPRALPRKRFTARRARQPTLLVTGGINVGRTIVSLLLKGICVLAKQVVIDVMEIFKMT